VYHHFSASRTECRSRVRVAHASRVLANASRGIPYRSNAAPGEGCFGATPNQHARRVRYRASNFRSGSTRAWVNLRAAHLFCFISICKSRILFPYTTPAS